MGLGHYINRIRINHAQQLLVESDLPIKHIAIDCGFNSSQSFVRAFRRATGIAPHQLRKNGNGTNMGVNIKLHNSKLYVYLSPCNQMIS